MTTLSSKAARDAANAVRGAANDPYDHGGSARGAGRIYTFDTLPEKGISFHL